jgi:hypothetical protein
MADLTNPNSTSKPLSSAGDATSASSAPPTILRCVIGSLIAGGFAAALYALTLSIVQTFANSPIHSDNVTAINIARGCANFSHGDCGFGCGCFCFCVFGFDAASFATFDSKVREKNR